MSEKDIIEDGNKIPPPKGGFRVFDSHIHPGFEKKDIEKRPGCMRLWMARDGVTSQTQMALRMALGDPNPTKPITSPDEIPDFGVHTWIKLMNENGVEKALLMGMDTVSDPPYNEHWKVPMEYIKEEFLDPYPDRFVAVAGINPKADKSEKIETVYKAKELGFKGVKIHTPTAGYPNDRERCYPIYEKCVELGLHVEIHTGVEEIRGTRAKYQDPVYVDDVAVDFPELRIVQLHCGAMNNPRMAIWNVIRHPNVYTDITVPHPMLMQMRYYMDLEHIRMLEQLVPHKVFFGTDSPLILPIYSTALEFIKLLPISPQFKKALLFDNAYNFYCGDWREKQAQKNKKEEK
ncbi:MAG: amidohydrolase [Candidatus Schekmanbacteria bacterium]|nr:MAG: amidohydrolase [Candidatus Schekmanbacteria bacterium]